MGDVGEEFAAGKVLLGKFLLGIGKFGGTQAKVFDGKLVVLSQAAADLSDHGKRHAGAVFEYAVKAILVQFQNDDMGLCGHTGGARRIVDERHFSKEISCSQSLKQAFFSFIDGFGDLEIPFQNHIKRVLDRILPAQDRFSRVRLDLAVHDDFLKFIRFDARKGTRDNSGGGSDGGHGCTFFKSVTFRFRIHRHPFGLSESRIFRISFSISSGLI